MRTSRTNQRICLVYQRSNDKGKLAHMRETRRNTRKADVLVDDMHQSPWDRKKFMGTSDVSKRPACERSISNSAFVRSRQYPHMPALPETWRWMRRRLQRVWPRDPHQLLFVAWVSCFANKRNVVQALQLPCGAFLISVVIKIQNNALPATIQHVRSNLSSSCHPSVNGRESRP